MFSFLRVIVLFVVISFSLPHAHAQEQAGVSLSPSLIEQGADPGEIIDADIKLTNISDSQKTYYLFTRDISGVRDGGSPIYAEEGAEKTGFEMSEWITLSTTEVTLFPGDDATVGVTIAVPESATPGSHFGAVFASLEPPRLRQTGAGVGFEVANIISLRIAGDALESAQIRSLATDKMIYGSTDVTFTARIENKGNVLVRPRGLLEVTNMYGKSVAQIDFNETLGGVFPNTVRDFVLTWTDQTPGFGRYNANLAVAYGSDGYGQQTITQEVSFWILPMSIIKPALIVLGVLLLSVYIGVRLYIRRYLGQVRRRPVGRRARRGKNLFMITFISMMVTTALFLLVLLLIFA